LYTGRRQAVFKQLFQRRINHATGNWTQRKVAREVHPHDTREILFDGSSSPG
jgi:hypothetical protein